MITWRDVRSYSDLERFLAWFQDAPENEQDLVLTEMIGHIEHYRQNESKEDLFSDQGKVIVPRQVEKRSTRAKRPRPTRSR